MITIKVPFEKVTPVNPKTGSANLRANSKLSALLDVAIRGGARPALDGDMLEVKVNRATRLVSLATVYLVVENGGEVTGKIACIKTKDIDQDVPAAFPSRTYTDEEGVEHVYSLKEWVAINHRRKNPEVIGEYYYVVCSDGFTHFSGSQLTALKDAGFNLLEADQVNKDRADNNNK